MSPHQDGGADAGTTVGRAGFLGGLLAVCSLVALSVVGIGHSRTIAGAANPQFWIVTAIVSATMATVIAGLARTRARTPAGEVARKIGLALAAVWLAAFLWEAVAIGAFGGGGPFELGWAAWKG